jgi:hypothetical protein
VDPGLRSPMVGCSVVTCGYLPYVRTLAESFHAHNADADFVVLLVDDHERRVGENEPFRVLRPIDVGIDDGELDVRGLMYTPTELVCSLRPALLRRLLVEGAQAAIQMDADGCVYDDLEPIAELARTRGTVLTPHFHVAHPPPLDGASIELMQIRYGVMNGGFLAAGQRSLSFLEWLDERLARHCVNAPDRELYLDQRWLDLAIGMFPHAVLEDPGCNVMCLNLHYRDVEWDGDSPRMPEGELRYFHFLLGFDPQRPEHICDEAFADRRLPYLRERPGAQRLARDYAARLIAHGAIEARSRRQHYDALPGGQMLDRHIRAAYRRGVIEAESIDGMLPPNPFSDGDSERLMQWLIEPAHEGAQYPAISRYALAIRELRPDLKIVFPHVPGEHAARFLEWIDAERGGWWMQEFATGSLLPPA